MPRLSIVIATHNRAQSLAGALTAISNLDYPHAEIEIIVADNGSTDNTQFIAESLGRVFPNFKYLYDPRPGQIVGWHGALAVAQSDILAFIDDDVRPLPKWASAIEDIFSHPDVALGTGPIVPEFDVRPPEWQSEMILTNKHGKWSALWGMLDFGISKKEIPPDFVWGSNFLVRKQALISAGGFHPGGMPPALFRFTGDGDVAAGRPIIAMGFKAIYHPDTAVAHHMPETRNSEAEIQRWIYGEGLVTSYVILRELAEINPDLNGEALLQIVSDRFDDDRIATIGRGYLRPDTRLPDNLKRIFETAGSSGFRAHQESFRDDPAFREWVLRETYLDINDAYRHPDLQPQSET